MFKIHPVITPRSVILSKEEFELVVNKLKTIEEIDVIFNDDPDFLTGEELEQLRIAEEEFEKGETISWEALKQELMQR